MSYVYFIQNTQTKAVKIGSSKHPYKRLKQLQTANEASLQLLHTIRCDRYPAKLVEKHIRKWFRFQRAKGEWRRLTDEDLDFVLTIHSDTNLVTK